MPRLPQPGGDTGNWGEILNEFLEQAHASDGALKDEGVLAEKYVKPGDGIPKTDLHATVQASLTKADESLNSEGTKTLVASELGSSASSIAVAAAGNIATAITTSGSAVRGAVDTATTIRRSPQAISGLGDSITIGDGSNYGGQYSISTTYFGRVVMRSGGRLRYVNNWGLSGATSATIIEQKLPSCLADKSSLVLVTIGTNDTGSVSYDANQTQENLLYIWTALLEAGKTPIIATVPPRSTQIANVDRLNVWIRRMANVMNLPLVDIHTVLVDPATGQMKAQYTGDGIHPNSAGRDAAAAAAWAVIDRMIPGGRVIPFPEHNADGANLLANSLFLTDANTDGLADSWTANNGLTGVTYSLVDHVGWTGKAQRVVVSGNAGSYLSQGINTGYSVGDTLFFCGRVDAAVDGLGTTWQPYLSFTNGSMAQFRVIAGTAPTMDADEWMFGSEIVVPSGTTSIGIRMQASGGTGTVEWGQIGLYNLTALGLA